MAPGEYHRTGPPQGVDILADGIVAEPGTVPLVVSVYYHVVAALSHIAPVDAVSRQLAEPMGGYSAAAERKGEHIVAVGRRDGYVAAAEKEDDYTAVAAGPVVAGAEAAGVVVGLAWLLVRSGALGYYRR